MHSQSRPESALFINPRCICKAATGYHTNECAAHGSLLDEFTIRMNRHCDTVRLNRDVMLAEYQLTAHALENMNFDMLLTENLDLICKPDDNMKDVISLTLIHMLTRLTLLDLKRTSPAFVASRDTDDRFHAAKILECMQQHSRQPIKFGAIICAEIEFCFAIMRKFEPTLRNLTVWDEKNDKYIVRVHWNAFGHYINQQKVFGTSEIDFDFNPETIAQLERNDKITFRKIRKGLLQLFLQAYAHNSPCTWAATILANAVMDYSILPQRKEWFEMPKLEDWHYRPLRKGLKQLLPVSKVEYEQLVCQKVMTSPKRGLLGFLGY